MTVAFWLQLVAILCTSTVSVYLIYAAWVAYRQFTLVAAAVPPTVFYLFVIGFLLLIFSAWRFSRAISLFRRFRAEYKARLEATHET